MSRVMPIRKVGKKKKKKGLGLVTEGKVAKTNQMWKDGANIGLSGKGR